MFLLDEDGTLFILKPSLSGYIESDRLKLIPDGQDAWAPLAIADGMMVLRDSKTMICIDLKN
jgi:outer membrane protein assembly factor BamB